MEFLKDFGVNPLLLLAQIVNFLILLLILKRFFYKPIMKVLAERKQKIETSVKQAEEIQKRLEETEMRQKEIISSAESSASRIIEETKGAAKKLQEETLTETAKKVEETLTKAKEAATLEREKMISQVKAEMADLVAETTKKVLEKSLTSKDNQELVQKSIKELES
ncbi:MAG: F0F1 ATP synthase subunit B [Candidatus Woykebacteria bacterium]